MASITVTCPSGHRLRGTEKLLGSTVKCPRCASHFVFKTEESVAVTDTGVMKILGDMQPLPPPPMASQPTMRPCDRCGKQVSYLAAVCEHCSCYIGAMPMFLKQIQQK